MVQKTINSKPLKKILSLLNNKYKFEIIYYLSFQKMRFGEIKENLGVITQQLLTKQLKQMEGNNLIIRKKYDGFTRKVEYSLTTLGCSLKPLVEVMLKWEKNNSKKINYLLKKKFLDSIYDYY